MITIEKNINKDLNVPIYAWLESKEMIDPSAWDQAVNLSRLPFVHHHVALMSDVHCGYGMPIGGVIATKNVIIPNAVGKDIGCGMCAVQTDIPVDLITQEDIQKFREEIKKRIPVGFSVHQESQEWKGWGEYQNECILNIPEWNTNKVWDRVTKGLGTLGGGNHFIEIQRGSVVCRLGLLPLQGILDKGDDFVWVMLHSGSRYLGNVVCDYYHKAALKLNKKWHSELPSDDLAFLPVGEELCDDYLRDMDFALRFAEENRKRMMDVCINVLNEILGNIEIGLRVNIHHNYATIEHHFGRNLWIHRKGATSAKEGEYGIIPGSMGAPSYIVIGKGNPMSFKSCSHGAGRIMGRMAASRTLTFEDCEVSMADIQFDGWGKGRKTEYDFGEAPGAYKDIDVVMENQKDLVDIHTKLLPLGVVKG